MFNPSFNGNNGGGNGHPRQPGMDMVQQQMMMMMQMQQAMLMGMNGNDGGVGGMGAQGRGLAERVGGFADAPLPPAPVGREDPRAKRGRVNYRDLDEPGGGGDGGLPY